MDAEMGEFLEYIGESDFCVDPEAEMDELDADEEPDMDEVIQDPATVGRMMGNRIGFGNNPQLHQVRKIEKLDY